MKKIILSIVSLTIVLQGLWAQDAKKFNFGLEFSPAITWMGIKNQEIESDGSNIKMNVGLDMNYNFTETYALATGLHFNTFGGNLKGVHDDGTGFNETVLYELQEFEVPIGLKLKTNEVIKNMRFTFNAGLGVGFAIKSHATKDYSSAEKELGFKNYENEDFDHDFMGIRGIFNLGLGTEYTINGLTLTGRLNYKGSLNKLNFSDDGMFGGAIKYLDLQNPTNTYNKSIKFSPNAFELCLGVLF